MAAQLSLAGATITDDDGNPVGAPDAPLLIRGNTMRIGAGAGAIEIPNVLTVVAVGSGRWDVTVAGASVYRVVRDPSSCCTGRR